MEQHQHSKSSQQNWGVLHFIGIGGIGMSAIAEMLATLGYIVQGSDVAEGYNITRLRQKHISISIGHAAEHLHRDDGQKIGAVVVSSAIKQDNPEIIEAKILGIPIVPRADMLGELMRLKRGIAIGGTHGKTTTTSMVGCVLEGGKFEPTVINGGIVNAYGTNARLGNGEWMVVEADESDGSFTRLPAHIVVVTNIDPEHMDHYGSFEVLQHSFKQFVEQIPFYGFAMMCTDHPVVLSLMPHIQNRKLISYGMNAQADVRATNIRPSVLGTMFDVMIAEHITADDSALLIKDIFLPMVGAHNVQNSLAAIGIGARLGMNADAIKNSLKEFAGVKRRFTKTGIVNGVTIIDDYGHHPVEIEAVLKAARQAVTGTNGRVIAVMQPHRYSRLSNLFDEFCGCFNEADSVLIADVYSAGEDPIDGANKESLVDGIKARGHKDVDVLVSPDQLARIILNKAVSGDFVICLGAGNSTAWANALPKQLEELIQNISQRAS
jgi:UDP-N-acetylmuramate--alanine ligase